MSHVNREVQEAVRYARLDPGRGEESQKQKCESHRRTDGIRTSEGNEKMEEEMSAHTKHGTVQGQKPHEAIADPGHTKSNSPLFLN